MPRRFEPQSLTTPTCMPAPRTAVSIGSTSGYGSQASVAHWLARMRSSISWRASTPSRPSMTL